MLEIRQLLVAGSVPWSERQERWDGAQREEGKRKKAKDAHSSLEQVYEIGKTLNLILFHVNGTQKVRLSGMRKKW